MLAAAFAILSRRLRMPPFTLFLIALSLTDGLSPPISLQFPADCSSVMTITFFLNVTDRGEYLYAFHSNRTGLITRYSPGSWLEIGQTISFFVIASLLLLWSAAICALGAWLMQGSSPGEAKREIKRT